VVKNKRQEPEAMNIVEGKSMRRNFFLGLSYIGTVFELGIGFLISSLLGFYLGNKLDNTIGSRPVFSVLFLLGGMALGFYNAWRVLQSLDKRLREKPRRP
jgi:F0F1-type ATP synthase assembly protein I